MPDSFSLDQGAKILFDWGPFALFFVALYVVEKKARELFANARVPKGVAIWAYSAAWMMILVLSGVVVWIYIVMNVTREQAISGAFRNLEYPESITSTSDNPKLFLRKIYGPNGRQDYEFRIVDEQKLQQEQRVSFFFERGDLDGEAPEYELPVGPSSYAQALEITYDRDTDAFLLDGHPLNKKKSTLSEARALGLKEPSWLGEPRIPWPVWSLPVVHAAAKGPPAEYAIERLDARDPVIRQYARSDLAKLGRTAIPAVERALTDADSSERVLLGVIAALNRMDSSIAGSLGARAYAKILELKQSEDSPLGKQAELYIKNNPRPASGSAPPPAPPERQSRPAATRQPRPEVARQPDTALIRQPRPSSDSALYRVQAELRTRGYYTDTLDGLFGPSSRAAIESFQIETRQPPTFDPEQVLQQIQVHEQATRLLKISEAVERKDADLGILLLLHAARLTHQKGNAILPYVEQRLHTAVAPIRLRPGSRVHPAAMAFGPAGDILATADDNGGAQIWDPRTGKRLDRIQRLGPLQGIAFSPEGSGLYTLSGSFDATLSAIDLPQGDSKRWAPGSRITFSPDGSRVASLGRRESVRVWMAQDDSDRFSIDGLGGQAAQVAFSPDGSRLAIATSGDKAVIWDVDNREILLELAHRSDVNSARFSPDGRRLATASDDNTVKLWDASSGDLLLSIDDHRSDVNDAAFSPDGAVLVTGGDDNVVRVRESKSGTVWQELPTDGDVVEIGYAPDGRLLAARIESGDVVVFTMNADELLSRARQLVSREELTAQECQAYVEPLPCSQVLERR